MKRGAERRARAAPRRDRQKQTSLHSPTPRRQTIAGIPACATGARNGWERQHLCRWATNHSTEPFRREGREDDQVDVEMDAMAGMRPENRRYGDKCQELEIDHAERPPV